MVTVVIQQVAPYMATLYREVSKCLASRNIGFRVLVGSTQSQGARSFGNPDDWMHGFEYEDLHLKHFHTPSNTRVLLLPNHRLLYALARANPDLIWVHERNPMAITSSIWARVKGRQSIISTDVGDNPPKYTTSTFHRHYHRWSKRLYHATIAMSKEAYLAANPMNQPRILIPHAVSTNEYYPSKTRPSSDIFRFIFVGSLDERKGVDSLIAAASALWQERRDFEVRIVGGGPLAERLKSNAQGWISMAGHLPSKEIPAEYQNAHAFILPSRQDTYAVVAHEAAACGLPLLLGIGAGASQVLLEEAQNGFLLNPDDPPSITKAMKWMLDHRDQIPVMAMAAREMAVRFGAEANAERIAQWLVKQLTGAHTHTSKLDPQ